MRSSRYFSANIRKCSAPAGPSGSLTVISPPPAEDDAVPKGFYLRKIKGVPWLRGYVSDATHVWQPDDHLVFCKP
ncbi:MAG: hypothetical protein JNM76_07055 [Betaproteobacteria bacterium]|nr:hypothetical protein [Betaproteobacteria bacterium]